MIFPGAKVPEIVHLAQLCIVQDSKVALSSEVICPVFGLATVYVRTNSGAAHSTRSGSDWALSKLSEINAISSAKTVSVIITEGKRRLLISVIECESKVSVAFNCGSYCVFCAFLKSTKVRTGVRFLAFMS